MSLSKDKFSAFRKDVLDKRKSRLLESSYGNVTTVAEIAAVLEKLSMVASIFIFACQDNCV
jgi:hypothetical protein